MNIILTEMQRLLKCDFGEITLKQGKNLKISVKNGKKEIEYGEKTQLARALSILKIRQDEKNFEYTETPFFKMRCVMLDMSRNAVMKVNAVKKYIAYMAAMGLNTLMLYTEDTYELKEYPFFGYMRGRYTQEELKEIDDYAYNLGVEVVPCIQTLGHMEQYLRYAEADGMKDTQRVMLCGADETYNFIETAIKFFKDTLRTDKIHIGMDEADDVGCGKYLTKNGYRSRCEIIGEHLEKVCKICEKYGLHPMMWSDMYCRMGSKIDFHYDTESRLDDEVIAKIPDVDMVYWDYYHDDENFYRKIISNHRNMKKHIVFASGIWTWDGLLPNVSYTLKTMLPAISACRKEKVDSFIATMWGDGGNETNHFLALFGLAFFSEYSFAKNPSEDGAYKLLEAVTGIKRQAVAAMDSFNAQLDGTIRIGTQLVWGDILLDNVCLDTDKLKFDIDYFEQYKTNDDIFYPYIDALLRIAETKKDIRGRLKKAYDSGDRQYLNTLCNDILPDLKERYEKLLAIHQKQWRTVYKVFGWEVINERYLISIGRIDYAKGEILRYLNGEIDCIEELEEKRIYQKKLKRAYKNLVATSEIF